MYPVKLGFSKDKKTMVKETKFSKSRTLPIHETTILKLKEYKINQDKLRNNEYSIKADMVELDMSTDIYKLRQMQK